jgi:hypothetical protein
MWIDGARTAKNTEELRLPSPFHYIKTRKCNEGGSVTLAPDSFASHRARTDSDRQTNRQDSTCVRVLFLAPNMCHMCYICHIRQAAAPSLVNSSKDDDDWGSPSSSPRVTPALIAQLSAWIASSSQFAKPGREEPLATLRACDVPEATCLPASV